MTTSSAAPRISQFVRRQRLALGSLIIGLTLAMPTVALASAVAPNTSASAPLAEGHYLYGESSTPETLGASYMVFQVSQQQVVGAFYQPFSSFDCFHGSVSANRMALTVIDSYDQTAHPYSLAMVPGAAIASAGNVAPNNAIRPSGFYAIPDLSENDQAMLNTCLTNYRSQES